MVAQFADLWAAGVAGVPFFDFIDAARDPAAREDLRCLRGWAAPPEHSRRGARVRPGGHLRYTHLCPPHHFSGR
jgi:hypothetical protein